MSTGAVSKAICPVHSYTFSLGQRVLGTVASTGTLPCKYFTPLRAGDVSLAYPNFLDLSTVSLALNNATTTTALSRTQDTNQALASVDVAFTSFNYREKHTITNVTNGQQTLTCYYIVCRRDIPFFSGATAASTFNAFNLLDWLGAAFARVSLLSTSSTGFDTAFPTLASTELSETSFLMTDAQLDPRMAPLFNHYFRIRRTKVVKMKGGGILNVFNNQRRRVLSSPSDYKNLLLATQTWVYDQASTHTVFKKGASLLLFKLIGQPVNSSDALSQFQINYHTPGVDVVSQCSFNYQARLKKGSTIVGGAQYGIYAMTAPDFVADDLDAVAAIVTA